MTKADVFDCRDGNHLGEVEVDWDGYEARSRQFKGNTLAGEIFDRETIAGLHITGQTAVSLAQNLTSRPATWTWIGGSSCRMNGTSGSRTPKRTAEPSSNRWRVDRGSRRTRRSAPRSRR